MIRFVIACLLLATGGLAHAEIATLQLRDGSSIRGEIESLEQGVYTVHSDALGAVTVDQGEVLSVQYGAAERQTGFAAPAIDPGQLQSLTSQLLADPALFAMIQSLKDDPQMQAVANDPEIQRAIASGDYDSLLNNPKLMELMQNSTIQSITQGLK